MDKVRDMIGKEKLFRNATINRQALNVEKRTAELSFSSEMPVMRFWGVEILDHTKVDMGRINDGAPLLLGHSADNQIGVIENARIDPDKIGRATVRFSKSAENIWQDVVDGIRGKVSVGYQLTAAEKMAEASLTPEVARLCKENKVDAYRVSWEPMEISLVSIPADSSVGVGRGINQTDEQEKTPLVERTITMENTEKSLDQLKADADRIERERKEEIEAVSAQYNTRVPNIGELKEAAIRLKQSAELFRGIVFSKIADGKPLESPSIGLTEKEAKRYSFRNAIMSQVPNSGIKGEFEKECSDEVAKRLGKSPQGVYVPYDAQLVGRDLTAGTASAGGYLVATQVPAGSFVEYLRNAMLMRQLGVQELSGLVGSVSIPKQTGVTTAYWVAENVAITESNATFGQVPLTPKTVGAMQDFSRQLLLQSTPSVDGIVQSDIAGTIAVAVDAAIINGSGAAGQPLGIYGTTGVGTATGASFSQIIAVSMESDVLAANAGGIGTYSFLMTPANRGTLKSRVKETGGANGYIVESDNSMVGYPVNVSGNAVANGPLFGAWNQAVLASWGTLDLLVDPYTGSSAGTIRVVGLYSVDVGVRQPGAFTRRTTFS